MNSSYSKKGLYSENKKLLPKKSSVFNYRGQRTKLISPNTVSSPSKNHCKGIIKAISVKVITKGPVIVYQYRIGLGGGGVGGGSAVDFCCYTVRVRVRFFIIYGDPSTT